MPQSSKKLKDVIIELERAEGKVAIYDELLSVCVDILDDKLEIFCEVFPKHREFLVKEVTKEINASRQAATKQINKLNNIEVTLGTDTPKQRVRKPRAKKASKSS